MSSASGGLGTTPADARAVLQDIILPTLPQDAQAALSHHLLSPQASEVDYADALLTLRMVLAKTEEKGLQPEHMVWPCVAGAIALLADLAPAAIKARARCGYSHRELYWSIEQEMMGYNSGRTIMRRFARCLPCAVGKPGKCGSADAAWFCRRRLCVLDTRGAPHADKRSALLASGATLLPSRSEGHARARGLDARGEPAGLSRKSKSAPPGPEENEFVSAFDRMTWSTARLTGEALEDDKSETFVAQARVLLEACEELSPSDAWAEINCATTKRYVGNLKRLAGKDGAKRKLKTQEEGEAGGFSMADLQKTELKRWPDYAFLLGGDEPDHCLPEQPRARSACFLNDATRAWAAEMQPAQMGMPPWHLRAAVGAPATKRAPRPAASRATMASSADELSTATVGLLPEPKRQRPALHLQPAPHSSRAALSASLPAASPELSGTGPCHSCGVVPERHGLQIASLRNTSAAAAGGGGGRANSGSNYPTSEPGTPQGGRSALLGPGGSAAMDFSLGTYDVTSAAGAHATGHVHKHRLGSRDAASLGACNDSGDCGSLQTERPQACCSTRFSFAMAAQAACQPLTPHWAAAAVGGKAPQAASGGSAWGGIGGSFGSGVNLAACDEDAFPSMGMGMPSACGQQCQPRADQPTCSPEMLPGHTPSLNGARGCLPSRVSNGLAAAGFVSSTAASAGFPTKDYSLDGPGGSGALCQNSLATAGFGAGGSASKCYGTSNVDTSAWRAGPSGGDSSAFGSGDLLAWQHPDGSAGFLHGAGTSRFDLGAGPSSSGPDRGPSRGPAEPTPADDMAMFDGYVDDLLTFDELLMAGGDVDGACRPMSPFGGTCAELHALPDHTGLVAGADAGAPGGRPPSRAGHSGAATGEDDLGLCSDCWGKEEGCTACQAFLESLLRPLSPAPRLRQPAAFAA